MNKARLLIPALSLLAISALALAACGSSESAEDKITSAIETAATSTDGSACTEVETANFVEQNTGESGAAAIKTCEKEANEGNNAESAEVSNVEVEGSEATADAAITGSALDGQTLEVALIEEEGDWKLNELLGFAKLDQGKLVEAFGEKLEESGEVEPELASCIVEGLEEAAPGEVEELFVEHSEEVIEGIAEGCQE
jgi:hypothetical protein